MKDCHRNGRKHILAFVLGFLLVSCTTTTPAEILTEMPRTQAAATAAPGTTPVASEDADKEFFCECMRTHAHLFHDEYSFQRDRKFCDNHYIVC